MMDAYGNLPKLEASMGKYFGYICKKASVDGGCMFVCESQLSVLHMVFFKLEKLLWGLKVWVLELSTRVCSLCSSDSSYIILAAT